MIQLNFDFQLKHLDDKEIPGDGGHAGKTLGNHLAATNKGEALKWFDWGRNLYAGKPINVDRSDYEKLLQFVETAESLSNLSKAQLTQSLRDQKKAHDEKEKATSDNVEKQAGN